MSAGESLEILKYIVYKNNIEYDYEVEKLILKRKILVQEYKNMESRIKCMVARIRSESLQGSFSFWHKTNFVKFCGAKKNWGQKYYESKKNLG